MTLFATWSSIGCWSWPSIRITPVSSRQPKDATIVVFLIVFSSLVNRVNSILGPLFKHLRDGTLHRLLILVAVIAQRVLCHTSPNQRLALGVVQVDDHGRFHVLLRSDASHSTANSAHTPCAIGCLLSHAAVSSKDQIMLLRFLHFLKSLTRHRGVDVLLRHLGQDRILNLVGVVGAPSVGVILGKTLAVVVVDR